MRAGRRLPAQDREILRLAVPALGALVAEPLFLLADSAIVGHLGTPQLAGLGVAGTVLATLVSVCVFLAYGTTAAVARRTGAGDEAGAIQQGVDGMWLAAGLGVVFAGLGAALAPPLVTWLGAAPAAAPYAVTYLRISALGLPAMLVVLAATGVLRGLQDTRTPLVVAVAAAAANVVLNVLLVYPVGLGIAGSALGTVLAQVGAAAAFVTIVARSARRQGVPLRPDREGVRAAGRAGVALVVRTVALRAVLVAATAVAARIGDVAVAAHQVAFATWSLLALTLDAVAIAGQALVGRLLGAGKVAAARAAARRICAWGVATGVVLAVAVVVGRLAYAPLFSADPQVQTLLATVLLAVAAQQPLAGLVFALDGVLIGAGDSRFLAWASIATTAVFLPAAGAVLVFDAGLAALWWGAMTLFLAVRAVLLVARSRGEAWLVPGASLPAPGRVRR